MPTGGMAEPQEARLAGPSSGQSRPGAKPTGCGVSGEKGITGLTHR